MPSWTRVNRRARRGPLLAALRLLVILPFATASTAVAYLSLLGLGLHRHGTPLAVAGTATLLVFGPAIALAGTARSARHPTTNRTAAFATAQALWSTLLAFAVLPVYFPGERQEALAAGIAVLGLGQMDGVARALAAWVPEAPPVAVPSAPEAMLMAEQPAPPPEPLLSHEIALPYDGEGRTLSVPVVLRHGDREVETWLMVDTGATYTALKPELLTALGVVPGALDPTIQLHTANGERDARLVQLDRLWLGDLAVDAVAAATCERCPSDETGGLLGLNVAGGFNVTIDADRHEMIFRQRQAPDRVLDVKPFVDMDASFLRYPGGRVEVEVHLGNPRGRAVADAEALVRCRDRTWTIPLGTVPGLGRVTATRRLPTHEPCPTYEVDLATARWQ